MNLDQRTIEILSQVVYKELGENNRSALAHGEELLVAENFWKAHREATLELARNIIRVNNTINP